MKVKTNVKAGQVTTDDVVNIDGADDTTVNGNAGVVGVVGVGRITQN